MCGSTHTGSTPSPIYSFNLYAGGAESQPLDITRFANHKYDHLKLDWTFFSATPSLSTTPATGVDVTFLDSLTGSPGDPNTYELLYYRRDAANDLVPSLSSDDGAVFVGLSGNMSFYYRDDKAKCTDSKQSPVNIYAQMDTLKLQDSQTVNNYNTSTAPYKNLKTMRMNNVKPRVNKPSTLAITSNGLNIENPSGENIFRINPNKWAQTQIMFTVTVQDESGYNILDTTTFNSSNFNIVLLSTGTEQPLSGYSITAATDESTNTLGSYRGSLSSLECESAQLSASVEYAQSSGYITDTTEGYFNVYTSTATGNVYKYLHQDVTDFASDTLSDNITTTIQGRGHQINTNGILSTITLNTQGTSINRPPGIVLNDPTGIGGKLDLVFDSSNLNVSEMSITAGGSNYTLPTVTFLTNVGATNPTATLEESNNFSTNIFAVSLPDSTQNVVIWGIETGVTPRLLKISDNGDSINAVPLDEYTASPGSPVDIKLDSSKNPWICCGTKVFQVDKDTDEVLYEITLVFTPTGMEIDQDGTLYLSESKNIHV